MEYREQMKANRTESLLPSASTSAAAEEEFSQGLTFMQFLWKVEKACQKVPENKKLL